MVNKQCSLVNALLITSICFHTVDLTDLVLCNHVRSVRYGIGDQNYTDPTQCQIIGYNCTSYDDFLAGKCGGCASDGTGCKLMPLNLNYWDDTTHCDSTAGNVNYYLNTGDVENAAQYCLFHYQLIVSIKIQLLTS